MTKITFGAQLGGKELDILMPHFLKIKEAQRGMPHQLYCREFDEIYIAFRVDGSVSRWNSDEITKPRFFKKRRYISIEIFISENSWKFFSNPYKDLCNLLLKSIEVIWAEANKRNIECNFKQIYDDLNRHFFSEI